MIAKFLRFPWGRTVCVVGALSGFAMLNNGENYGLPAFAIFVFAGVALHAISVWRDKP